MAFNKNLKILALIILILIFSTVIYYLSTASNYANQNKKVDIDLDTELSTLIYQRTSVRDFTNKVVAKEEVKKILWSAEGITVDGVSGPTRSSPSAGATNPLEIFLAVNTENEDLSAGLYHYQPQTNSLQVINKNSVGQELAQAALNQSFIQQAPVVVIIAADLARTTSRYGERGNRYVYIESGHAGQNVSLMAENLGYSTTIVGAFNDEQVREILGEDDIDPILIIPVGEKK